MCSMCDGVHTGFRECSRGTEMTWQLSVEHRSTQADKGRTTGVLSSGSIWGSDSSFTRYVAVRVSAKPVVCSVGS
jgi:hypothetical protein